MERRAEEAVRPRSRSDSFSDGPPLNPPGTGSNGVEPTQTNPISYEGRIGILETQMRNLVNTMDFVATQVSRLANPTAGQDGPRADPGTRVAGSPNVMTPQRFTPPMPSPGQVPFAPEVPVQRPEGVVDPVYYTDPWRNWLNMNGPPPPGLADFGAVRQENDPAFDRGPAGENREEDDNPFRRSEKWMPQLPRPNFGNWKSRPQEVVGFVDYCGDLASWTGLGNNAFPREIMSSLREGRPITYERLQPAQVTRSIRLFSILKMVFEPHPRASLILRNYEESLGRIKVSGFEGLRLLAREFGINTRTELMFFRQQITGGNFFSQGATIPEIVRKVQFELLRFEKVSTLVDPAVNLAGCEILEADKIFTLLKSLPHACKTWLVLNVVQESFEAFCEGALRYESQQRVWSELSSKPVASMKEGDQLKAAKGGRDKSGKGKGKNKEKNKQSGKGSGGDKPSGKGSGDSETRTCFKCGKRGHLQKDCRSTGGKNSGKKNDSKGKPKGSRATELTEQSDAETQPEEEQAWSEIGEDEGGRLTCFMSECEPFARVWTWREVFGAIFLFLMQLLILVCLPSLFCTTEISISKSFLSSKREVGTFDEPQFWLVDSGASRSVCNEAALEKYQILRERELTPPVVFRTASGQEVQTNREVVLEVYFRTLVLEQKKTVSKISRFEIRAVVGPVEHNLLSVTQLCRMGSSFYMDATDVVINVSETRKLECQTWSGVPWLEAKLRGAARSKHSKSRVDDMECDSLVSSSSIQETSPTSSSGSKVLRFSAVVDGRVDEDIVDHPLPAVDEPVEGESSRPQSETSDFSKLQKRVQLELSLHRRRGHIPFDNRCVHCISSRSVLRHERGKDERASMGPSSMLIQADFCFIGPTNSKLKFVVMSESMTGMIGAALIGSNIHKTLRDMLPFFRNLGIHEGSQAVEVLCDAEPSIMSLLMKLPIKLVIKQAAPQHHQTVGRAERSIRKVKEMVGCLRSDLRSCGFDIFENEMSLVPLINYVVQTHNYFGVGCIDHDGSRRSPQELALSKDLPKPEISMFGSICHAMITDAVRPMLQPGLRFTLAAYLYPAFGGLGHVVSTIDTSGKVIFFTTKVKPLSKLCWDDRFCPDIIQRFGDGNPMIVDEQFPTTEERVDISEVPQHRGPPKTWVLENGPTEGCTACNAPSRQGKKHSSKCHKRYDAWLRDEQLQLKSDGSSILNRVDPPKESNVSTDLDAGPSEPPRPAVHPTGGRRTAGKQSPVQVIPDDADDVPMGDVQTDSPLGNHEPSIHDGDDDADMYSESSGYPRGDISDADILEGIDGDDPSGDVTMGRLSLWEQLSEHPDEDWMNDTNNHGILYPYFIPKKGEDFEALPYTLCGKQIFLVRPTKTISEDGQESFSVEDAERGRVTELDAMGKCDFGILMDEETAKRIAKERGTSIIPCRWVITSKTVETGEKICRSRCVAQQIAAKEGASAMSLGISSSTPSLEAFRIILTLIGSEDLFASTIDVSTAFLHSSLPEGVTALVRLPGDLSFERDRQVSVFADLSSAMNGLRAASKSWLNLCTDLCRGAGLISSPSEPSILAGKTVATQRFSVVLVYVDDLIIASTHEDGIQEIKDAIASRVKVKTTGAMTNSSGEGGSLRFLGKDIRRPKFSNEIHLRVHPDYLQDCMNEWDLKSTLIPPDILQDLEKSVKTPESTQQLTPEAAARFRRLLGKLMWWGQVRPDLGRHLSLLASGMASPTNHHEAALRRTLRYVKGICHFWTSFPTAYEHCFQHEGLFAVADASWGPSDMEGRRSTTGGVIYWRGCVIKAISRLQTSISLSSCESETIAVCQIMQECIGLRNLVEFVTRFNQPEKLKDLAMRYVFDLNFEMQKSSVPLTIRTDSESCLAVLRNDGLSRRVRHLCLAICFIQRWISEGSVSVGWISTAQSVADLMTKVLGRDATDKHRASLGIHEIDAPVGWQIESKTGRKGKDYEPNTTKKQVADVSKLMRFSQLSELDAVFEEALHAVDVTCVILDICTCGRAGFQQVAYKLSGVRVVSITESFPIQQCGPRLSYWVDRLHEKKIHVAAWLSPPCTGGSPLLNFNPPERRQELWDKHFSELKSILSAMKWWSKADLRCLELSDCCSYWREELLINFLQLYNLEHFQKVDRCAFVRPVDEYEVTARHPYRIASTSSMVFEKMRTCQCQEHCSLSRQDVGRMDEYPFGLAMLLGRNIIKALRLHDVRCK